MFPIDVETKEYRQDIAKNNLHFHLLPQLLVISLKYLDDIPFQKKVD
jgi:hypothetical protein